MATEKKLLGIVLAFIMMLFMFPIICGSNAHASGAVAKNDAEITLEFGTGHETLAADFAAYLNGDSSPLNGCDATADGSKVKFYYADREASVAYTQNTIGDYLVEYIKEPYLDNGDPLHFIFIIESIPNCIGQKTIDNYSSDKDILMERGSSQGKIPDKQTFYVLWDKPIKNVSMSVEQPVCGVETKLDDEEYQTNPPKVTVSTKGCSIETDSIWLKPDCSEWFSGIFKGGENYGVRSFISADFGHYFPDDAKCSIKGGSVLSPEELPEHMANPEIYEKHWMNVLYRVKAVHDPAAPVKENEVKPTCTKNGSYDSVAYCKVCKKEASRVKKTIKATGHKWGKWKVTKKATTKAKGQKQRTCAKCGAVQKRSIPKLKAPSVVLMAKVTAKGKTALKVKWNTIKAAAGYDIFMSRCNYNNKVNNVKIVKTIRKPKTFKWIAAELEENTCYKICVKAFKMKNGKKKYFKKSPLVHAFTDNFGGDFTNVRKVMVKKKKVVLEKGDSFIIKAKLSKQIDGKKLPKTHAPKLRYISSDKKVAKVTRKGKIKAVKAGKAKIYVFAHNGVSKTVKVEVK